MELLCLPRQKHDLFRWSLICYLLLEIARNILEEHSSNLGPSFYPDLGCFYTKHDCFSRCLRLLSPPLSPAAWLSHYAVPLPGHAHICSTQSNTVCKPSVWVSLQFCTSVAHIHARWSPLYFYARRQL